MRALVAFILALVAVGISLADPETVDGLLKKNTNTWQVPIVAKQPNENKPTQVVGGYPKLMPDTLARPLKAKQDGRPFGNYLPPQTSSASAIPQHVLQWLAQRQSTTTTMKSIQVEIPLIEKPAQRSPQATVSSITTLKPKLIQRPSYKPVSARETKKEEEEEDVTFSPKVAAIMMDDYMARKKDKLSVAGLVIGLTFVAAFISIAIGLVGHGLIKRCRYADNTAALSGRSSRNSWMRTPTDDDRTPPELRPGSNCSGGRRNSARTRHVPGTLPGHGGGTPFFNGKLILHDPPGLANGARGVMRPFSAGNVLASTSNNGFMMTSPPSKLGAIPKKMPSPAAQVTDILVSPKYEDGETTEEEDSEDTVYECPGLGTTKGMEVRNPFYMQGNVSNNGGRLANKKPISQYTDLFHHQEIVGLN